ncbi:MAG: GNAT family N-acetyltransferase [Clostridiales bacterium]|jgi:phosphinothricin acetyltransferase|nr:GNAT family N-acetyltransferase [Clostridiales bacterium]
MKIRLARLSDAAALAEIYAYYVENFSYSFEYEAPGAADFARRIESTLSFFPFFVCEGAVGAEDMEGAEGATGGNGGESVIDGYAYAHFYHERKAYQWVCETSVYTRNGRRQRGVGTALYKALLPALASQGFTKALAVLGCPNEGSEIFHQKMGFTQLAEFKNMGYKFAEWHDVKYYEYQLNPVRERMAEPISYATTQER